MSKDPNPVRHSPHPDDFSSLIEVRPLRAENIPDLVRLGALCYPDQSPWTEEHLHSQLELFPEGQFVVLIDHRVAGAALSLRINFDEYADGHTWEEISGNGTIDNHEPDGDTLYGIEIMVDPEFRGMKLARRLYAARKELCSQLNLRRIVFGGRIPGYGAHKDELSAREYVERVQTKDLYDPVLTMQLSNGFVLKRLIRSYHKEDVESDGWATFMEWVNLDYHPDGRRRLLASRKVRLCAVQYGMRYIESFEEFAHQCEYFVDTASDYRSDFVVFPELLTNQLLSLWPRERPGVAVRKLAELTPQYLELFTKLAIQYNVNIIGGSHFTFENGRLLNVAYLFQRDGSIDRQAKLHATPDERLWWGVQPGDELHVFDTDRGRVAINICYDVEFPELARRAVELGARILFVPFCTDERQGYLRVRYCAQARCVENQIYTVISGTVGNLPQVENMDIQYAQSAILTPSDFAFSRDAVGAECTPNVETLVFHDVDLETLERFRRKGTVLNWNDRRTDLYEVRWKGNDS